MSLRFEQYNSLKQTKEFFYKLLTKDRPKKVKELKEEVLICLRHFPPLKEDGEPIFSKE